MPLENMEVNFQQETLVTDVSLDKLTREGKEESCKKVIDLIKRNVLLLEKGVSTKENRFFSRVVRNLSTLKKKLTAEILFVCISQLITDLSPDKPFLLSFLNSFDESLLLKKDKMDIDNTSEVNKEEHKENISYVPEVDVYLQLLVLLWLIRQNRSTDAISCADNLVERFQAHKRRTLDILYARVYFYYALVYETADRANEIRKPLMLALRTATLRHNFESQSTLTNLLIRNFILYKLYDAAEKFISRCSFPEVASNNEWARYHYYLGRTKAVRLQYSEAKEHLEESLRKAPQNSALGFQQEVQKWLVVVHLLLGLIPDRLFFQRATMGKALIPYLAITYAVRQGDLISFNKVVDQYAVKFIASNLYNLVMRCRHNVIKTGVKLICTSYSRISLRDICFKLNLDSPETTEYIVAKAIRDGVIDATINHIEGYVQTKENCATYNTAVPQDELHKRISYCMKLHNDSVKSMRFPDSDFRSDLESSEERRIRELQEKELAQEIAAEEDEEEDEY